LIWMPMCTCMTQESYHICLAVYGGEVRSWL
jgi:hypothetical protein